MSHAILVLGAAMRRDGSPGPALIRRARHAAALFHRLGAPLVLASGGFGEAEAIAAICRKAGVPEARLVLEPEARNTAENIAFSAPLLAARGVTRVTLVSDYYHLPRARLIARRHGLAVTGSAPPHRLGPPHRHAWLLLREAAAWLKALPPQR